MGRIIYICVLLTLRVVIKVHSLECYVCSNCATVTTNDLKSCPDTRTTTSPPTSAQSTAITAVPSTVATTTMTPINNSTSNGTETNPTVPGTNSITNGTENSPRIPGTNSTANGTERNPAGGQRKRRSTDKTTFSRGCFCESGKCDCSGKSFSRAADSMATRSVTYQCYKYVKTVNGSEVVERGCQTIPEGSNRTACAILNATNSCKSCDTDQCNSALSIQFSIVVFIFAFFLWFI